MKLGLSLMALTLVSTPIVRADAPEGLISIDHRVEVGTGAEVTSDGYTFIVRASYSGGGDLDYRDSEYEGEIYFRVQVETGFDLGQNPQDPSSRIPFVRATLVPIEKVNGDLSEEMLSRLSFGGMTYERNFAMGINHAITIRAVEWSGDFRVLESEKSKMYLDVAVSALGLQFAAAGHSSQFDLGLEYIKGGVSLREDFKVGSDTLKVTYIGGDYRNGSVMDVADIFSKVAYQFSNFLEIGLEGGWRYASLTENVGQGFARITVSRRF